METQIFEKNKAILPLKKILWPIFSRSIEQCKRHGTTYKSTQSISASFLQTIKSFFRDKTGRETNISQYSSFHGDKRCWTIFPGFIEPEKPQGPLYGSSKGILTITVDLIRSIF